LEIPENKLKEEKNELVSATTHLKLLANDGKRYFTDLLDYNGIVALATYKPKLFFYE
jgi:cell filamentation protein